MDPVSATQVETYELCPRKWGWNKLEGIPRPPNRYAERGLGLHKVAAGWLEHGTPVDISTDEGKIFVAGLHFLPSPGSGQVECKFEFETNTAKYIGFCDYLEINKKLVRIIDHKTTTDFKWMRDLHTDVQANLYTVAALGMAEPGAVVQLDWVYYLANPKKTQAKLVRLTIVPDGTQLTEYNENELMFYSDVRRNFDRIEKVAAKIVQHHECGDRVLDLPYNVEGCMAYGGCPYSGHCNLTSQQLMRGYMAQQGEISLAEKIAARKAAAVAASKASAETQAEAPAQSSTQAVNPPARGKAAAAAAAAVAAGGASDRAVIMAGVAVGLSLGNAFPWTDPSDQEEIDAFSQIVVRITQAIIQKAQ